MSVTVATRFGVVAGVLDREVHCFRAVPYARSPVGERRFRPPEPPDPWPGVRDARQCGPAAPQRPSKTTRHPGARPHAQSESCLSLDLWTPAVAGVPRPVLVWIHAGRFLEGSASLPDWNGRRLARRGDVVVVTLQYRLGVLGFLHAPDRLDEPGTNLGLLDQIAALEWVRDEIDAFGGDPGNVTIFGSGSGATCASALLAMPHARSLFRRAILQSPRSAFLSREAAERRAQRFLDALGPDAARADRLRALPLELLLDAQERCAAAQPGEPYFAPVIDGVLLPHSPPQALGAGDGAGCPLLVGCNRDETYGLGRLEGEPSPRSETELMERLRRSLGADDERVGRVLDLYRRSFERTAPEPGELWHAIASDHRFRTLALALAEQQSRHEPQTYVYRFDGLEGTPTQHGLEVPFVFGTLEDHSRAAELGKTARTTALARQVQDAWIAFAHTGHPNHAKLPPWPPYAAPRRATMILAEKPRLAEDPWGEVRALVDLIDAGGTLGGNQESARRTGQKRRG
ncbi:MAG: carboxylesterase/lipase family protein [Myxococcota bacterium]